MKRRIILLLFILSGLCFVITSLTPTKNVRPSTLEKTGQPQGKSTNAMPEAAIDQLMSMTMDPILGRRTPEALLKARDLIKKGHYKNHKDFTLERWTERGPVNVGGRTRAIVIDQNDPTGNTVWAGSVGGGLWKTVNFLSEDITWSPINDFFQNIAISSIVQDPNNLSVMYFGTGEGWFNGDAIRGLGIWKTVDGGANWEQLSSSNNYVFAYIQKLAINTEGHIYACTREGGLQRSVDGGTSWTKILGGGIGGGFSNRAADIEVAANGDLYASFGIFSSDGIYKSTNSGATWSSLIEAAPQNGLSLIHI